MSKLVVFSGLPGAGKTTLARAYCEQTGAVHLRVDMIEDAILRSSLKPASPEEAGYLAAYAQAEDNLKLGRDVVADAVNALEVAREGWRRAAMAANAEFFPVEIICTDAGAHKTRITERKPDLGALPMPDWTAVQERVWEPWAEDHVIRIETARRSVDSCLAELLQRLSE